MRRGLRRISATDRIRGAGAAIMRIVVTGASWTARFLPARRADPRAGHRVVAWSGRARASGAGWRLRPVDLTEREDRASRPSTKPTRTCRPRRGDQRGGRGHETIQPGARRQRRGNSNGWPGWCRDHGRRLVLHVDRPGLRRHERSWYREEDEPRPDPGLWPHQGRGRIGGP